MRAADYLRIPLRRRDGSIRAHALIDQADAPLAEHNWCMTTAGYAMRYTPQPTRVGIYLHRAVLGLTSSDDEVDHINRDRLDNRRENLRVVTRRQNAQNVPSRPGTSEHRGVCWDKRERKWRAYVTLGGTRVELGMHRQEQQAAAIVAEWRAAHMPFATN